MLSLGIGDRVVSFSSVALAWVMANGGIQQYILNFVRDRVNH